jgi:hypothetical protein
MDLMRRINDGDLKKAPAEHVERVKRQITENCEELIEVGARIRPLLSGDRQVGWVRGLHPQERRMLKRWIQSPNDYIANTLLLATSLTPGELEDMTGLEVRALAEVVRQMTECDMSLYPFIAAYVTTQSSENLWYGRGEKLTSYENKTVTMPDGKQVRIMCPPDHARAWASLCAYREQAKHRLEDNFNAVFMVRPMAGKSADPIYAELKSIARAMETDSMEPWQRVVKAMPAPHLNDGWAHAGDSVEDLQRELKGMLEGDKHERLMEAWQKQMEAEAKEKQRKLDEMRKQRGTDREGIIEERYEVLTDAEVKARQAALKAGKKPLPGAVRRREDAELDPTDRQLEKIRKYV